MHKAFIGILLLLTSFSTFASEVGTIYGPTTPEETIWSIARKVHPDAKIPVSQTVAALYQANPQAFMGKNMNRLMKDVYLTVPTLEAIQAAELVAAPQKTTEKPKVKKTKAAKLVEPPKPEPIVAAPQPTPTVEAPVVAATQTTPVLETPQTVEVTSTITTTSLPEEPVLTPITPVVEATLLTTSSFFDFSSLVFKPFEWILISLLSFLSLLVIWMLFSLNRTYKYLLAQRSSPIVIADQELSIKKILTEAKTAPTKTESPFLDTLDNTDDISTKLDLARAYIEMHEHEPAKRILQQALKQGNPYEQQEAHKLLNLINTVQ